MVDSYGLTKGKDLLISWRGLTGFLSLKPGWRVILPFPR